MTSLDVQEKTSVEFPSIVFCSLDAYKKVEDYVEDIDFSESPVSNDTIVGVLSQENKKTRLTQFVLASFFDSFNDTLKEKIYKPLNETIISCIYDFELCNKQDFSFYSSATFGPCLRYTPPKRLTKTGIINGLRLDMLLDPPTQGKSVRSERGLNIVIKSPDEQISYYDGFSIKPGQRTSIAVSKTIYKNLPKPYTSCVADGTKYPSELYKYIVETLNYTYNQE